MWRVVLKISGTTLLLLGSLLWWARRDQTEELWLIYKQYSIGDGGGSSGIGRIRWNDLRREEFAPENPVGNLYRGIALQPNDWLLYRHIDQRTHIAHYWRMRPDGRLRQTISALPEDATLSDFSPDGEWMYYTKRDATYHRQLYRLRLDGRHREQLAEEISGMDVVIADWSADGQWVYLDYGADLESVEGRETARMRPDGSDFQYITEGRLPSVWPNQPIGFAGLSPDNQWVYFYTYAGIYRIRTDGRNIRFVVPGHRTRLIGWSAEGEWMIFRAEIQGGIAYFRASVAGTTVERLAPPDDSIASILTWGMWSEALFDWSPDQQWAIFAMQGGLYRVRPDGTGLELLPTPYSSFVLGWWTVPEKEANLGLLAILALMLMGCGFLSRARLVHLNKFQ